MVRNIQSYSLILLPCTFPQIYFDKAQQLWHNANGNPLTMFTVKYKIGYSVMQQIYAFKDIEDVIRDVGHSNIIWIKDEVGKVLLGHEKAERTKIY